MLHDNGCKKGGEAVVRKNALAKSGILTYKMLQITDNNDNCRSRGGFRNAHKSKKRVVVVIRVRVGHLFHIEFHMGEGDAHYQRKNNKILHRSLERVERLRKK
jgi:hypothetical protein